MPVTVAMGNAYYVYLFVPMVIAMRMPMPTVMGMAMTMCTGTYTIGKHAPPGWRPRKDLKADWGVPRKVSSPSQMEAANEDTSN